MVRVIWSRRALDDLDLVRSYVEAFDPVAAGRLAGRLLQAGESLQRFPNRGHPVGQNRRKLSTVWPYIIQYRVTSTAVHIERIRHGAQLPDR